MNWKNVGIGAGVIAVLLFAFYIFCLNHVEINEIGVAYNSIGGNVWVQDHPGWYVTSPMVKVTCITTLPMKVTIPSDARVINTKIVRFRPEGIDDFIRLQGFSYSYGENGGIENTLMGYAFSGKQFSFLEIVQDSGDEKTDDLRPLVKR